MDQRVNFFPTHVVDLLQELYWIIYWTHQLSCSKHNGDAWTGRCDTNRQHQIDNQEFRQEELYGLLRFGLTSNLTSPQVTKTCIRAVIALMHVFLFRRKNSTGTESILF